MFPKRQDNCIINRRHTEVFEVNKAKTERYRKSAIPYMQNLLNQEHESERRRNYSA